MNVGGVGTRGFGKHAAQIRIPAYKARRFARAHAKSVGPDQNLLIAGIARADADGGEGDLLGQRVRRRAGEVPGCEDMTDNVSSRRRPRCRFRPMGVKSQLTDRVDLSG